MPANKDPQGLPELPELSQTDAQSFALNDIQSRHRDVLFDSVEGEPSIAKKALDFSKQRNRVLVESLGSVAEQVLEPHEFNYVDWDPQDPNTKVVMALDIGKDGNGNEVPVPAVRFERTVALDPHEKVPGFSGVVSAFEMETVPMAEVEDDGSLKPTGDFDEIDLQRGQELIDELLYEMHRPDGLTDLSPDLTMIIHPKLSKALDESNLRPEDY